MVGLRTNSPQVAQISNIRSIFGVDMLAVTYTTAASPLFNRMPAVRGVKVDLRAFGNGWVSSTRSERHWPVLRTPSPSRPKRGRLWPTMLSPR
jgi:hypothetical protein